MFLIAAALLATSDPPKQTGQCRWVSGRFNLWNGSSVRRIWIIGTRRVVAVRDQDADVPGVIKRISPADSICESQTDCSVSSRFVLSNPTGPVTCSTFGCDRRKA